MANAIEAAQLKTKGLLKPAYFENELANSKFGHQFKFMKYSECPFKKLNPPLHKQKLQVRLVVKLTSSMLHIV